VISSIWLQAKNYRKPLLQRYVVRILLMVPIYSISSWTSMVSLTAAQFLDPIRDIYEAFTIYTFFWLLINYLGGERSVIVTTHGRAPVEHLWPLNHVFSKVDISDPHTFLLIKRGILQYAWLKPILAIASIIMKATGTYQEGYIGVTSGYFWSGIIYNISVTLSLYYLGLFWVCMHDDLLPFRPIPKFLCIKLIIFASYWQGFLLSILVWIGAIPDDVQGYTPDNLAAAIQDALICVEMPIFAVAHWYAFSWHDFADNSILSARMSVRHAFRDSFGLLDLIIDSRVTLRGDTYGYRVFDSGDRVMAHEDSKSRLARLQDGMRYERGGKGKYWIPKPGQVSSRTPLLDPNRDNQTAASSNSSVQDEYDHGTFGEPMLDDDEERLYENARQLEYGDWNYPVITASEPLSERYYSASGNFAPRPSAFRTPSSRTTDSSSNRHSSPGSRAKGKQRSEDHGGVVPVRQPKQKPVKPVKHEEPDTSKLHLDEEAPSKSTGSEQQQSREDAKENNVESSSAADNQTRRQASDYFSRFGAEDREEFRDVWSRDEHPK
jgi:hypothetical protein